MSAIILDATTFYPIIRDWYSKSVFTYQAEIEEVVAIEEVLAAFQSDWKRYYPSKEAISTVEMLHYGGIIACFFYRISRHLFLKNREDLAYSLSDIGRFLTGIELFFSAEIGEGLRINHGYGCVVGARCKVGKNVTLHQGVTLGDKAGGRPVIGDNVMIYPNAVVIGAISVGNKAIIGANSVVMKNVPENYMAVGAPAKLYAL